jgi:transcriptional antiterminator NusG
METQIFVLRTTANREDQVVDFITSHVQKKKLEVYSVIRPHGMRGYIFLEAKDRQSAEESFSGIPYAKGLLPKPVDYKEIEPMLEQVKIKVNIQKNDIVEIITGPFKREKAKVVRIDTQKEEVVLELLETAIPIPLTLKLDAVKVIRRENATEEESL